MNAYIRRYSRDYLSAKHHMAPEHVLVAARALGKPIPAGCPIHHVDENKSNNANSNLVICQDRAYHHLLHVRSRVVRAGGDPNTQRVCGSCAQPKDLNCFNKKRENKSNGRTAICRDCQALKRIDYKARKFRAGPVESTNGGARQSRGIPAGVNPASALEDRR